MRISDLQARAIIADRIQVIRHNAQDYLTRWKQRLEVSTLREGQVNLQ
jgi:hypothetical protein